MTTQTPAYQSSRTRRPSSRLLAAAATAVAMTALAACSGGTADGANADGGSLLKEVKERGYLRAATTADNAPTIFRQGSDVVGLDADWAKSVADSLGVEIRWEIVQFSGIVPGLSTGKYDLGVSGMNVTEERKKVIDFSTPYAQDSAVAVFKPASGIKPSDTVADALKNRTVCVVAGSANGEAPVKEIGGYKKVVPFTGGIAIIMQALTDDRCDLAVTGQIAAHHYISELKRTEFQVSDEGVKTVSIAFGLPPKNSAFREAVDKAMTAVKRDGKCTEWGQQWLKIELPDTICGG
jgi:polar amino acid transport system substrate-binding protein